MITPGAFRVSENTARNYWAAEQAFEQWRLDRRLRFPVGYDQVAAYLRQVLRERGPFAVRTHLSVIGRLYRQNGLPFDTKTPVIQTVVKAARGRIRGVRERRNA